MKALTYTKTIKVVLLDKIEFEPKEIISIKNLKDFIDMVGPQNDIVYLFENTLYVCADKVIFCHTINSK